MRAKEKRLFETTYEGNQVSKRNNVALRAKRTRGRDTMAPPALYSWMYLFESPSIESLGDLQFETVQKMHEMGIANAFIQNPDVVGSTSDTTVAVCYVGIASHKWMAVAMAAGPHAKTLTDQLIKKFESIEWF